MIEKKTCTKCLEAKALEDFGTRKSSGTVNATCRACVNLKQREYRAANIDKLRIREQAYREANREHIRSQYKSKEYAHEQYIKNKDKILDRHKEYNNSNATTISEQKKQYYKDNKEHILARSAKYFAEHRDEYYARNSKRRALLQNAIPSWITSSEQERINLLYKIARKVQNVTGVLMHVDHIYPLKGKTVCGLHCLSNLQILTAEENLKKGNSFPDIKYLKD